NTLPDTSVAARSVASCAAGSASRLATAARTMAAISACAPSEGVTSTALLASGMSTVTPRPAGDAFQGRATMSTTANTPRAPASPSAHRFVLLLFPCVTTPLAEQGGWSTGDIAAPHAVDRGIAGRRGLRLVVHPHGS